ncbi:MAG: hypothetical protein HZB30_01505 [Nitrospirae bacterium]|nr:hypothetical protein [Nitrospirota bacterium]
MQKIPLSLAKPGMVLAKEVRKEDDDVSPPICGKGIALTESLLSRLEKMGIQAVAVEGHPVKMEGDESLDELLKALDKRFSKVMDDPLMIKLKDIYREHIIQSMEGQDAGPEN